MQLIFKISNVPIMVFDIDHDAKTAKLLNNPDELAASIILSPNERTYLGIEARLNHLTNKKLTLQEQMQSIQKGEFYADSQHNLNFDIDI